jgi:hypothetical protein
VVCPSSRLADIVDVAVLPDRIVWPVGSHVVESNLNCCGLCDHVEARSVLIFRRRHACQISTCSENVTANNNEYGEGSENDKPVKIRVHSYLAKERIYRSGGAFNTVAGP